MGEGLGGRNLKPNSEALSLEAGTERMKALMSGTHGIPSGGGGCVQSLLFHVLRTDRRTGREECKAHVN